MFQSAPLREGRPDGNRLEAARRSRFNPRPCARGDAERLDDLPKRTEVSIRAPARGATRNERDVAPFIVYGFNPRPCARGDLPELRNVTGNACCFNPRPCARGDSRPNEAMAGRGLFQSAPLREGRPPRPNSTSTRVEVSIRAPARGATIIAPMFRCCSTPPVSIRAPARGAT